MPDEPRKMTEERWSSLTRNALATLEDLLLAAREAAEGHEKKAEEHAKLAENHFHKVLDCVIMNPGCGQDNGH